MGINVVELMARMVAQEKAAMLALATPVTADAVPYFWHSQEAFPYFTNRVAPITVEQDEDSEDIDVYTYDIIARLVIGHVTSGYKGEPDANLQTYIPHLIEYLNERELLQTAAYPLALDNLTRARVTGSNGYAVFNNQAIGLPTQVGTEFTVRCEFTYEIRQQYY